MTLIKEETFHEAWDCTQCGTEGLSAFNCKQCPTCGAPLDEEVVYRTNQKVENYQFKGHDIICAHCQTRNKKRFSCRNCGASLTDEDDARVKSFFYQPGETTNRAPTPPPATSPLRTAKPAVQYVSQSLNLEDTRVDRQWWYFGMVLAVLIIGIAYWIFSRFNAVEPVTLIADRAHWSYHLALEDFQRRQKTLTVESGSFSTPPTDAKIISKIRVHLRSEAIYETRRVSKTCQRTSSKSNGDGTWTQSTHSYDCSYNERVQTGTKEIYGTRFDYMVDRWEAIAPITKEGWGQTPVFPTFTAKAECLSTNPSYGCIRAPNAPQLTFSIYFSYPKEGEVERQEVKRSVGRSVWEGFKIGHEYPAVLNGFGSIRAIQGLDDEYQTLMAN